ncbi:MAG: tetratricopeptide repeat protein [Blautia sp.]|uniref:Sel1 repeat family protein n=1 Tax=Blautia argi TaxID=1912897 RepID=A0A2Z4UBV7_9FIRM|nr:MULTISPECIES: tetratricopeptide repeat protein [Blautia]AWY98521.1 sel1 repeat family protein [Blautia argi]
MDMKNLNLTVDELKILAENGQRDFIYGVGYYYENGIRTAVDYKEAVHWYEKAAKKEHVEAAMHLALLYAQGKGVEKDDKKAFFYMNQAAKSGNMNAQYNMGRCYEEGIGTKPDISKAFDWYKKAAAQGDFRAMCCMGAHFLSGEVLPYEPAKAFQLFEKAANANIPAAQYNLSVLYRYGEGVEKDIEKADFWRMKAAQNGFRLAIDELEHPEKADADKERE